MFQSAQQCLACILCASHEFGIFAGIFTGVRINQQECAAYDLGIATQGYFIHVDIWWDGMYRMYRATKRESQICGPDNAFETAIFIGKEVSNHFIPDHDYHDLFHWIPRLACLIEATCARNQRPHLGVSQWLFPKRDNEWRKGMIRIDKGFKFVIDLNVS